MTHNPDDPQARAFRDLISQVLDTVPSDHTHKLRAELRQLDADLCRLRDAITDLRAAIARAIQ